MSPRPNHLTTALSIATLLFLTGCTAPTTTSSTRIPAPTRTPAPTTSTTSPADDSHDENPGPAPAAAAEDAQHIATAAMTAFAQPTLPTADWYASISPYLSDQGKSFYKRANPALIPATAVTGTPSEPTGDLVTWATVTVPTDAGIYTVNLVRPEPSQPWKVLTIVDSQGRY